MPDLFDVMLHQRACRSFGEAPVGDELVERVLEAATHAPSAENRQPWVFVVVRDAGTRGRIGEMMLEAWEAGGLEHSRGRLSAGLLDDVDHGMRGGVSGAPVLVVVAGDSKLGLEGTLPSSVFPAVQNLLLAAAALGLGSTMTTIATASPAGVASVLGLPDHVRPLAVVPLGWPATPLRPPRRRPVASCAHRERYGKPW